MFNDTLAFSIYNTLDLVWFKRMIEYLAYRNDSLYKGSFCQLIPEHFCSQMKTKKK